MTYQEKHDALQKSFTEKFNAYEKLKDETLNEDQQSEEFLRVRSEFEKINYEYQEFLMKFKNKNASSCDEPGVQGKKYERDSVK